MKFYMATELLFLFSTLLYWFFLRKKVWKCFPNNNHYRNALDGFAVLCIAVLVFLAIYVFNNYAI